MEQMDLTVSQAVRDYIGKKPYILEAIEQGIVNYSALARKISEELGIKNYQTVKVALMRSAEKYRKVKRNSQEKALRILRDAHFSIKNKVAALHHSDFVNVRSIAFSKTPSGYMFFLDENVARRSKFRNIEYSFAILHIRSSKEIENTPGVLAFILSALAAEGINIHHVIGCREDTFLVLKEYDAPLAFKILSEKLRL